MIEAGRSTGDDANVVRIDVSRAADDEEPALRRALRPRGPVQLALSKRLAGGATVVEVAGELDVLTASKLGAEIDWLVRKPSGDVVIDLRATRFMDSAGLQVLLSAQRRLSRRQRRLAVICEPGPVRRVIEQARLLGALRVVSSPADLWPSPPDDAA